MPALPILVGVSGHRNIHPQALAPLREHISCVLRALQALYPTHLQVMTALAEGADQEVAGIAAQLGIPVVCILPMPIEAYRCTMAPEARERFDRLYAGDNVSLRFTLPPVQAASGDPAAEDVLQYEQLAILLSRQSHILLALWNGEDNDSAEQRPGRPRRAGRGGTAHTVAIRTHGEYVEVAAASVTGSRLFAERLPRLELARCGPVLHLHTPRATDSNPEPETAGMARWWSDMPADDLTRKYKKHDVRYCWQSLPSGLTLAEWERTLKLLAPKDFDAVVLASNALQHTGQTHARLCMTSGVYLGLEEETQPDLERVRTLFGQADTLSFISQQKLLGDWVPGMRPRARTEGRRQLGALFWFALAIPTGVSLFETYCEYGKPVGLLLAYAAVLGLAFLYYNIRVKPGKWQELYQDHRALAEALRVQFYWSASQLPLSVSDNYLRQHEGELGWIRLALRGPSLWAMAAALMHKQTPRKAITHIWMDGQRNYFQNRLKSYEKMASRLKMMIHTTIGVLCICIAALALAQLLCGGALPESVPESLRELPSVLIGVLPAILVFFLTFQEMRLLEEHIHAYDQAAGVFEHAEHQARGIRHALAQAHEEDRKVLDDEWKALMITLGKESLAENATWVQAHRSRPITAKMG